MALAESPLEALQPSVHRSRINAFGSPKTQHWQIIELSGAWTSSGLEIGAHIAAVPSNGHDSRRAEHRDYIKNQRLSETTEVVCGLQHTRLNSVRY
jgi:hypothetical protein